MEKQSKLNRRGFLKFSVIGATGSVVGQCYWKQKR